MDNDAIRLVIELELALLKPEVRRRREVVDDLLDRDFREVGASGRRWTRGEVLDALAADASGELNETIAIEFEGFCLTPNLVLLSYTSKRSGARARRTSLWRRTEGAWRVLHHQGTPVRDR